MENVKVPKPVSYHSLKESLINPALSSDAGYLQPPHLAYIGRSEQLHLANRAIWHFQKEHSKLPGEVDVQKIIEIAKAINEDAKK